MSARRIQPPMFTALVIPEFPVWAMRTLDPELGDRQVAVVSGGRVVARSEGLARMGLHHGQSAERVRSLAPGAVLRLLAGMEQRLAWEDTLADLNRYTPWIEPLRPGRAWLRFARDSEAVEASSRLRAQVGMAADRSTALLAALAAEEGSLLSIPLGDEEEFRAELPLEILGEAGVGPGTLERLAWLGFARVGSLARLTRPQLCAQFEEGALLDNLARTGDRRPVPLYVPPPVVSVAHHFDEPAREPAEFEPVLHHLLEEAAAGLQGRRASLVTVRLEGAAQRVGARRVLRAPTLEAARLWTPARLALKQAWPARSFELQCLEVDLGGLVTPRRAQGQLWPTRPGPEAALRVVESRFPGRMLRVARLAPWSVLPEEAAALEPLGDVPPEGREQA